ncbi:energy transducer TonB [Hymenobacter sp. CRA2]|uniref:energy transducer TonB n=1 Tax=Hymenobacter sp. CRA2 TaxID=1955620 RepID=UPI00098FA200|nr:energy transducer TonB [Hymenobacter sp. CRA2]OON67209.1 hypothetical protein B0919_18965 [Hymenobacter sp. CRA2]
MQRPVTLLFALLLAGAAHPARAQQTSSLAGTPDTDSAAPPAAEGSPAATDAKSPTLYYAADVMPSFPGGAPAQLAFLREKLHFPDEALRRGLSGKVLVQFIVDERGHLLDPKVVRGLGPDLDAEALRLVRIMPWWTPGLVGGQPVKVQMTLPIVFRALE